MLNNCKQAALIPLLLLMLHSCMPGGAGMPARKKWPELNGLSGAEGYAPLAIKGPGAAGLPFRVGYTDVMTGSGMATMFAVSLPGAGEDSLVMSLVNTYRPLAIGLLAQWAPQLRNGLLIDLRDHAGEDLHRADYLVQYAGAFSIPVTFLWDRYNAGRAADYMSLLQTSNGMRITQVSGESIAFGHSRAGFGSCFPAEGL